MYVKLIFLTDKGEFLEQICFNNTNSISHSIYKLFRDTCSYYDAPTLMKNIYNYVASAFWDDKVKPMMPTKYGKLFAQRVSEANDDS